MSNVIALSRRNRWGWGAEGEGGKGKARVAREAKLGVGSAVSRQAKETR